MKYLTKYKLFEDKEDIIKQASKYKSLLDLKRNDITLYKKVMSNHLNNLVFPKSIKWTKEKIEAESEKYNNKSEFGKKSPGAYNRASGLDMLDELFPSD